MERDWGLGAWIDLGNIMTNVMTVARAYGLETCPQQAWAEYGRPVRKVLNLPDQHVIVSGMALGYRSEEHTSALQSLMRISYAVFCLKKKNNRLTQSPPAL